MAGKGSAGRSDTPNCSTAHHHHPPHPGAALEYAGEDRSEDQEVGALAAMAESYGARISCENTSEDPVDMKAVLDANPGVMLTVDIGHGELLSDQNKSLGFINAYPDRIGHIHIHDNIGGDTYHEDLHLPLGEGRIDFAPILLALRKLPQEITITFEMPRQKAYEGLLWLRERELT